MRFLRVLLFFAVVLIGLHANFYRGPCFAWESQDGEKLVLRSLSEVREWISRNGSESVDVDLEAQLVFAGPKRSWFAIQSNRNAIRVICSWHHSERLAKLYPGQFLRVKGVTVPGKTDIRLEGFEVLEPAKPIDATPIWQNVFDRAVDEYAMVETELLANEFYVGPHGTVVLCHAGMLAIRLELEHSCDITQMHRMIHAKILARGALSPIGVDAFSKYSIHCMRAEQVEIVKDYEMSNLRVKRTRVLFSDHVSTVVIEDEAGPLVIDAALARNINPGDAYDIFYVMDEQHASMDDAKMLIKGFSHRGSFPLNRGTEESTNNTVSSSMPLNFAVRTGKVISQEITRHCFEIQLADEHIQFRAIIPKWQMTDRNLELRVGDTVKVSGAPVVSTESKSQLLKLYIAHRDDIAIVKRLDEDSSRRLRISLIGSMLILGVVCIWAILLRIKIQRRNRQLTEITQQLREIFNTVQYGLVVCDKRGRIIKVNNHFQALFGFSPRLNGQLLGLTDSSKARLFSTSLEQHCGSESLSADAHREFDFEVDGKSMTIACHNSPILDPKSRLIGVLWVFADVTEKRLFEEKMISAQRMEVVGRLAGGMAHDFNNILTVIKANLFVCSGHCKDSPELMTGIELAGKAVESAEQLTKSLLGLAKKTQLALQVVNLREFMTDLCAMISASFNESVSFRLECEDEFDCFIKVDVGRLQQVIINLCLNAKDALDNSAGLVTVRLGVELCDGVECACISVSDNGKGIPEGIRNRVFEPFFSTKPQQIGAGLGLSVALGLVEQMGGSISFNSVVNEGTTFVVRFECFCGIPSADLRKGEVVAVQQTECLSETSVLVIDDDDAMLQTIKAMISSRVGKTAAHSDVHAAIDHIAKDCSWDVVLLDMYLQNASGCDVAQRVRQLVPGARILFMSGNVESAMDLMRSNGFGDCRLLQKPFDSSEVVGALSSL